MYDHFGYGTTIYGPLSGGFLTGKYLEGIPDGSRCATDNGWLTKERSHYRALTRYGINYLYI